MRSFRHVRPRTDLRYPAMARQPERMHPSSPADSPVTTRRSTPTMHRASECPRPRDNAGSMPMDTPRRTTPSTWRQRLTSMAAIAGLLVAGLFVAGPASADPAPGYNVFAGYADTLRPLPQNFPTPYDTGSGLVDEGLPGSASLDGGAIRI